MTRTLLGLVLFALFRLTGAQAAIPITHLQRTTAVDFETEILPVFRSNCLACHNQTRAKAGLVLETPQTILKGSENGPVIVPGRSQESPLLKVAAHLAEPSMPPRDNKVAASNVTSLELGLLQLWIDQGAKGEVLRGAAPSWQTIPESFDPIYAVALSADGQYAACNRASQLHVYHLPSRRLVSQLADPELLQASAEPERRLAHRDLVRALAFSPDGNLLASGGYREVKLWRRPRDVREILLPASDNKPAALACSEDGEWIATGHADGHIQLINLSKPKVVRSLTGHASSIQHLGFSPDNTRLLSSGADQTICLWNLEDDTVFARENTGLEISAIKWLEDGKRVACGSTDGRVRLWLTPCQAQRALANLGEFPGGCSPVTALARVPCGPDELLIGDANGIVRLWNVQDPEPAALLIQGSPVVALAASSDGASIASAGLDNSARLWTIHERRLVAVLKGDRYAQERVVAKARALRAATNELALCKTSLDAAESVRKSQIDRVRKATDSLAATEKTLGERQKKLDEAAAAKAAADKALADLRGELADAQAALSLREAVLEHSSCEFKASLLAIAAARSDHESERADLDSIAGSGAVDDLAAKARAVGEAKVRFERMTSDLETPLKQATDKLTAAQKSASDAESDLKKTAQAKSIAETELTLAIAGAHKAAESSTDALDAIPPAETGVKRLRAELETAQKHSAESERPVAAVAFSPDNLTLAAADSAGLVHTWSATSGQPFETFRGHSAPALALAFPSPGRVLSFGSDGSVLHWNLAPGWKLERILGGDDPASPIGDRVNAIAFSADSETIAVGSGEPSRNGQIQLWKAATGRLVKEFNDIHSDAVLGLEFSPSGKHLASCAADRFMKVVDLSSGRVTKTFEGHTHHVLGVAWKADGRSLATAGADNFVKIWDFQTGQRKKNIEGFSREVTSILSFGADHFAATSGDGQVRVFNPSGDLVRSFAGAKDFVYAVAADPDGRWVIAGGQESVLRVWNGATGQLIAQWQAP